MNGIINETWLWFCEISERTINFTGRLRHSNSNSHKHSKEYGTVVNENEFIKSEVHEVKYIFNEIIKACAKKKFFFHLKKDVYMILNS